MNLVSSYRLRFGTHFTRSMFLFYKKPKISVIFSAKVASYLAMDLDMFAVNAIMFSILFVLPYQLPLNTKLTQTIQ
jgi:hypothetical protein